MQPPSRLPLTKPWIFDASCAFAICCIQTSGKEKIVWNNATLPGVPVIIIKATECVESLIWSFHHNIHVYEFDIKLFREGMLKGTEYLNFKINVKILFKSNILLHLYNTNVKVVCIHIFLWRNAIFNACSYTNGRIIFIVERMICYFEYSKFAKRKN